MSKRVIKHIDDIGRIVIPKQIRKKLGIKENDAFQVRTTLSGKIVLKKCNKEE